MEETQLSITEWGNSKFPPRSASKQVIRMNKEMAELLAEVENLPNSHIPVDPSSFNVAERIDAVAEELADVYVFLVQLASMLNIDLHEAVNQKMGVNRKRAWKKLPDGSFQHV